MEDVVAVADVGDDEPVEAPEVLAQRQQVGERLAGMLVVRQRIDDRDRGLGGKLLHDRVRERPDDDPVDPAVEVARDVRDALADAEADVARRKVDRVAAELAHAGLERHPRPQARLLEQHRQRLARQRRPLVPPQPPVLVLQRRGPLEDELDLVARQVRDRQEIPPAKPRGSIVAVTRRSSRITPRGQ